MNRNSPRRRKVQSRNSSGGLLRDRVRAAAREAILDAVEQVFGDEGLDVRMETIAARAGVAVGTLYNHFPDRGTMLEALFEARHFELVRRLETTLTQVVGQPFGAQLSAVLTTFTDTDVKHVRLQRALLEEGGSRGPEHRQEAREDVERIFSALFTEGERQGVLPAQEHQVLLAQLLGLLRATFDLAIERPQALPMERVCPSVTEMFLHGAVRRRKASPPTVLESQRSNDEGESNHG